MTPNAWSRSVEVDVAGRHEGTCEVCREEKLAGQSRMGLESGLIGVLQPRESLRGKSSYIGPLS